MTAVFAQPRVAAARHRGIAVLLAWIGCITPAWAETPRMGLAYQPYVGQWSQTPDNPYASDRFYTPSFNTYVGGLSIADPAHAFLRAEQRIDLYFAQNGRLRSVEASGRLDFDPTALEDATDAQWSRTLFRFFDGQKPGPAQEIDNQASVFRQLSYLVEAAQGAPLKLATYGAGFQPGYWRELDGEGYATLPVWTDNRVRFHPGDGGPTKTNRSIDALHFHFPPTAVYVKPDPSRILIQTQGEPGRDLKLDTVHLRLFAPARKQDPGARLNPGFFAGDANGQIALAAAEINARAGKRLLTIEQGVENAAVYGTLINDRMRFAILSALAQAKVANDRFPGTVTHLIVSNEYATIAAKTPGQPTPTEQIAEMVRFAKARMAPGGEFAGLGLRVGVRGNQFRALDPTSTDPAIQQFTRDVKDLLAEVDFLMENIYPSPEALDIAASTGNWDAFFAPKTGELDIQWTRLTHTLSELAEGRSIELMIGEIGQPTDGIPFNLSGQTNLRTPAAGSATAQLSAHIDRDARRLTPEGLAIMRRYCNPELTTAFLTDTFAWSRKNGVQIHIFEAFDEPYKFGQNLPLPGLSDTESLLSSQGNQGAEGFYGLFGYTGVASFQTQTTRTTILPGSTVRAPLGKGQQWAGQFSGRLYSKLPEFDFAETAAAFKPVISH